MTSYLLKSGKIRRATGIEINSALVDKELLEHSQFSLLEGNICDTDIKETYNTIFYGAVHHHVVRDRGMGQAIRVFRDLVKSCTHQIFFETGQLSEGGRWEWQRALESYFPSDEAHFFCLLRTIEPYIVDYEVAGKFWIHGVRRWLLRLIIRSGNNKLWSKPHLTGPELPNIPDETIFRPIGSRNKLAPGASVDPTESAVIIEKYLKLNPPLIRKRFVHFPNAAWEEYSIGSQVSHEWAVRPIGMSSRQENLFHLISGVPIIRWLKADSPDRKHTAQSICKIFKEARGTTISLPESILMPVGEKARLLDVIDLNPSNILVQLDADKITFKVIDFEKHSNHYCWKNKLHEARLLARCGDRRMKRLFLMVSGLAGGLGIYFRYQFYRPEIRIRDRQPSLLSLCNVKVRSAVGRVVVWCVPRLAEK